jgi:hypothetical protein
MVVNIEQTFALWLLMVIMAVPSESRFVVFLKVSLSRRPDEKRGYCSMTLALICQSTSEVA